MRMVWGVPALAIVFMGCANLLDVGGGSEPPSPGMPEAPPATAPPEAAPPPEAPAVEAAKAVTLPEGPPAALTWLEPGAGGCVWSRMEIPAGTIRAVFSLDAPCDTLEAPVWSPSRDRAVIWQSNTGRAWELRGPEEARIDLPRPPLGAVWDSFGYGPDGALMGFSVTTSADPSDRAFTEGGQTWDASPDLSAPALVHAFALEGDRAWRALGSGVVEGDLTRVRAPISASLDASSSARQVRYNQRAVVELDLNGGGILRRATANESNTLSAIAGQDGPWAAADIGRFRVAFHVFDSGDGLLPEPPFYQWEAEGWRPLDLDNTPPEGQSASFPALGWSGPWLVAAMAPYRVVLIDLRGGRTLWQGPGSYAVLQ